MHLHRNFVWTLDLSDRELKVIIKCLSGEELSPGDASLATKLSQTLVENEARLNRLSAGRHRGKSDDLSV
ncbi:MAG: hypothetical protein AB7L09_00015 [Nitrospira sp.]